MKTRQSRKYAETHPTQQFYEASSRPQGHFFRKTVFFDMVYGSVCSKFQVFVVFRLVKGRDKNIPTDTNMSENGNIMPYRLLASCGFEKSISGM